jgi:hypothetical protein
LPVRSVAPEQRVLPTLADPAKRVDEQHFYMLDFE